MSEELERVYEAILVAIRRGEPAAVATLLCTGESGPRAAGAKMVVLGDGRTVGTVGGGRGEAVVIEAALTALRTGESSEIEYATAAAGDDTAPCESGSRALVEVLPRRATVLIVGAGHVGQALAELASVMGYHIVVVDGRPELLTRDRFPSAAHLLLGAPEEALRELPLAPETYVAFVTPHASRDERVLALLAEHEIAYVGLMGGRRRSQATFERARALGVPAEFLERIHTPIGLSIGAQTPREIAVSILAEIIAVGHGQLGA